MQLEGDSVTDASRESQRRAPLCPSHPNPDGARSPPTPASGCEVPPPLPVGPCGLLTTTLQGQAHSRHSTHRS